MIIGASDAGHEQANEPEGSDETAEEEQPDQTAKTRDDDEVAPAEPAPVPPETPPPSSSPDPANVRAEAMAHARAVVDLCRLAGQPQMVGRFLEKDTPLNEVRAVLLAAKARDEPEIAPHHPQPGPVPAARPWGEIVARAFKLKG